MIASAEEFAQLRTSEDLVEQARATHDPAPIAVWIAIIERYPELRRWVAHNKTIPLEILAFLAGDDDVYVRRAVAAKRKLDRDLFALLARDPDEIVRRTIGNNAKCPPDIRLLIQRQHTQPKPSMDELT